MTLKKVSDNTLFWQLSNDLHAAIDTGNHPEVELVAKAIGEAYDDGLIDPDQAGELIYDVIKFQREV